jgi:soluble lytic murein transglycosylase
VGRLAALLFFAGPVGLIAIAVSLRTARAVESYRAVMDRVLTYELEARAASLDEEVAFELLCAVASAESSGRPDARSSAGAVGLMQLMGATAAELAASHSEPRPDLTDPATSLRLGARYLRIQLQRFGATSSPKELALAAYNAGPGKVDEWLASSGGPAPGEALDWIRYTETRAFVRRVLDYEARFRSLTAETASR